MTVQQTKSSLIADYRARTYLLAGAVAYSVLYIVVYRSFLGPNTWDGFQLALDPGVLRWLSLFAAVSPALILPVDLKRPSQLCIWTLYLTVFAPGVIIAAESGYQNSGRTTSLIVTLLVGFITICSAHWVPVLHVPRIKFSSRAFWLFVYIIVFAGWAWIVAVFHSQMRIVGFGDVLSIRYAARQTLELNSSLVGYATGMLGAGVHPFLMAYGVRFRKWRYFLIGAGGQVLVYSATAMRSVLLSTAIVLALAVLTSKTGRRFGVKVVWIAASIFSAVLVTGIALALAKQKLFSAVFSILIMRTFGIPGLLLTMYDRFSQQFPITRWSHIHGVDLFLKYPFGANLGFEVGMFYKGNPHLNSSAGLWCTDGLAAYGLFGVVVISIVGCAVLWTIDSVAAKHDVRFAMLALTYTALNFADNPLFTTLISGGLVLQLMLFYLLPATKADTTSCTKGLINDDRGC